MRRLPRWPIIAYNLAYISHSEQGGTAMNDRRGKGKNQGQEGDEIGVETIAETENYVAWLSHEPDGETVYHLELGPVTLHFFREEFLEVLDLVEEAAQALDQK
jgi:hypothetical protein